MSNLIFLRAQDFYNDQGPKGKILCNNQKGLCLVLFHADASQCTHCEETIPEFKKLPYRMPGVKFALCNVNANRQIVPLSSGTNTALEYVPYIVLYANGRPIMRYDGERNLKSMSEFLTDVVNRLQNQKSFTDNKNVKVESDVTTYRYGTEYNVVCDAERGICYLSQNEAYPGLRGGPRKN